MMSVDRLRVINLYFKLVQFCFYADRLLCHNNKVNDYGLPKPSLNITEFSMDMLIYILSNNFNIAFQVYFFMKQVETNVPLSKMQYIH